MTLSGIESLSGNPKGPLQRSSLMHLIALEIVHPSLRDLARNVPYLGTSLTCMIWFLPTKGTTQSPEYTAL
jgi:hypothetical protein